MIEQGGAVKAAYGYTPYGMEDDELSAGDGAANPLNSYRYSGKRFDSGSGTINMGARHFSPSIGRFLQADSYAGATRNLGLSRSPLTGNRYSLAGGNPIGYIETDGHAVMNNRHMIAECWYYIGCEAPPDSTAPAPPTECTHELRWWRRRWRDQWCEWRRGRRRRPQLHRTASVRRWWRRLHHEAHPVQPGPLAQTQPKRR